jgi:O-methyltransferase
MTFRDAYAVARRRTLISESRCRGLWLAANKTAGVPGDVLELGTFRGGSLYLLAAACPERRVYGVDTFAGMPPKALAGVDVHQAGEFHETSLEMVQRFIDPLPNAIPVAMTFPDGLPAYPLDGPFSLAHFDGDLLASCRAFLDHVLPRLSPGGAIVFDDYKWGRCPGVQQAIEERDLTVTSATAYQALYVSGSSP